MNFIYSNFLHYLQSMQSNDFFCSSATNRAVDLRDPRDARFFERRKIVVKVVLIFNTRLGVQLSSSDIKKTSVANNMTAGHQNLK